MTTDTKKFAYLKYPSSDKLTTIPSTSQKRLLPLLAKRLMAKLNSTENARRKARFGFHQLKNTKEARTSHAKSYVYTLIVLKDSKYIGLWEGTPV